jgi:hypothetical protein
MVAAYKIIFPSGRDIATEDETYLATVIQDMRSHGGFWFYFNTHYIRGLWVRRKETSKIVETMSPEESTHITCRNRKCELVFGAANAPMTLRRHYV